MITAPIQLASAGICGSCLAAQNGGAAAILSVAKRYFIKISGKNERW